MIHTSRFIMKFTESEKKNLIDSAKTVYNGYLAMDFFKSRPMCTLSEKEKEAFTLQKICDIAIASNELNKSFFCNGKAYLLELTKTEDDAYNVQITPQFPQSDNLAFKKRITDYSDEEVMAIISKQHLTIGTEAWSRYDVVSNTLTTDKSTISIGGRNRMDLYRTHLVTLHNIIEKISSGDDISSLLVALATGSGKTYVQGLWMLSLYLAGNSAFFGVPDKLVVQFKKDLACLLPESFLNTMSVLRQDDSLSSPDVIQNLDSLQTPDAQPVIIIGSSEELLDKHYQRLLKADTNKTFLSFDEQHLLMRREVRRVRLIELSKRFLTMYLTATPNNETYALAGKQPVAIMSSGQKQDAGQGQFPVVLKDNAKNISDRNSLKHYKFWTGDFWNVLFNNIKLRFFNAFQHEESSSAISIIENLPFYLHRKPDEADIRWSMQVPMAHKMLWIIDDNETLVNACQALENGERNVDVYHNGNMVNRQAIAEFFNTDDPDKDILNKDFDSKKADYKAKLLACEKDIGNILVNKSLSSQLEDNILHNMMEYVLCEITGLDEIEHNRLRKADPSQFQRLIRYRLVSRDADYYFDMLKDKIDRKGAREIAHLLAHLSNMLFEYKKNVNDKEPFNQFVDNWHLNHVITSNIRIFSETDFDTRFKSYVKNHRMFGLVSGMSKAETPVLDVTVFSGMEGKAEFLFDKDGMLVENAKKRKLSPLEQLNDTTKETVFTPTYMEGITEQQADNYFRLGFVGIYASNRKTEGFSDRNLHTVINFADTQTTSTNSPESLIQGIGRNRGLDATVVPTYIFAMGRKVKSYFNLDNLKKNDYYPDLFKSQKVYNNAFITTLGQTVAKDIIFQYNNLVGLDETIDAARFNKEIFKLVTTSLRKLNDNNGHDIQLSRKQLARVVGVAMKALNQEIQDIKNPSNFTFFTKVVDFLLHGISELYYMPKRAKAAWKLYKASWLGAKMKGGGTRFLSAEDTLYVKIIRKTSYKKLVEKLAISSTFKSWMERKKAGIQEVLEVDAKAYFNAQTLDNFKKYQTVLVAPLLAKFVKEGKKDLVIKQVNAIPNILLFLEKHQNALMKLKTSFDEKEILAILQEIQGLESLTSDDLDNYPKKINDLFEAFEKEPLDFVREKPLVKEQVIKDWAVYLKGPFIDGMSGLLLDKDWQQLKDCLQNEKQVEKFLENCFNKPNLNLQAIEADVLFQECRVFFELDDFKSPVERVNASIAGLSEAFEKLQNKDFSVLSVDKQAQISLVIKQQLLPCLVNYFPLESRGDLLLSATLPKIEALIRKEGMNFNISDGKALATTIFTALYDKELPKMIVFDKQEDVLSALWHAKLEDIKKQSTWSVLQKKLRSTDDVVSLTKNKLYVYDKDIVELLQSETFLNAISPFLPYNQWLEFKTHIKTPKNSSVVQLARGLIDSFGKNVDKTPDPETLLGLVNKHLPIKFTDTQSTALSAKETLDSIFEGISDNPANALDKPLVTKIAAAVRESLLPTLALFITDNALRQAKLSAFQAKSDNDLCNFCLKNQTDFNALIEGAGNTNQLCVTLINTLLSKDEAINLSQVTNSNDQMALIQNGLLLESIVSYLSCANFLDAAALILNETDVASLKTYLQEPTNVRKLAQKLLDNGSRTDLARIFRLFNDLSGLAIKPLTDYLKDFEAFIESIKNFPAPYLDKEKCATLLTNNLAPILFHKELCDSLDAIMGYLSVDDIYEMLVAIDRKGASRELANNIIRFLEVIKKGDKTALQKEFFSFDNNLSSDFDGVLAKKVIDKIRDIADEIATCHAYYNNHDKKGTECTKDNYTNMSTGALVSKLTSAVCNTKVEITENYLSDLSRKVFFIHGLLKALPVSAKIEGESYAAKVQALEKVYAEVLRPLWWSLTFPNMGPALVKLGHGIRNAFKRVYFYMANLLQKSPQDEVEHLEETLQYTTSMNALNRLNDKSVADPNCQLDTIRTLEEKHDLSSNIEEEPSLKESNNEGSSCKVR